MVGFFTELDKVENYEVVHYPESKWIELVTEGKISDNVLGNAWQYIHAELLDKNVITKFALIIYR